MLAALSVIPFAATTIAPSAAADVAVEASPWERAHQHSQELLAAIEDLSISGNGNWRCVVSPDGPCTISFEGLNAQRSISRRKLDRLIERHHQASQAYLHWADLIDEIVDGGRIPPIRVWCGRLLRGLDANGIQQYSPLYANTRAHLQQIADDHYDMSTSVFRRPEAAAAERRAKWLDEKFAELYRARRRHNSARRRTGMVKVEREIDSTIAALDAITYEIIIHRPADLEEAEAKRQYVLAARINANVVGGDQELMTRLLSWFCEPTDPSTPRAGDVGRHMLII